MARKKWAWVCSHMRWGMLRSLRSCVPLISWWPCRNFSTHAHFFHITSCCLIWSWNNFAVSQRERERGLLPCQRDTQAKEVRWDETNKLRFLQLNCWIFYCANDIRWRGLSNFFEDWFHLLLFCPFTFFLPRQLSLFWHISDSCHCFNCIRRWQVYSLRGGVWCPQVNVPSRGHVGTSKMSSWLKNEKWQWFICTTAFCCPRLNFSCSAV